MIVATDSATAAATRFARRTPSGSTIWRSNYFGPSPSPEGSASVDPTTDAPAYVDPAPGERRPPQAFLVQQEPGAVVHPHFHYVDQFQVIVEGGGEIGNHPLAPLTVHFAGACTGYGPIRPGPQGLGYFTFRASADSTGAQFLPAMRDRRRPIKRRYILADPIDPLGVEGLKGLAEPVCECILAHDDGLAAHMLRLPPGSRAGSDRRAVRPRGDGRHPARRSKAGPLVDPLRPGGRTGARGRGGRGGGGSAGARLPAVTVGSSRRRSRALSGERRRRTVCARYRGNAP